MPIFWFGTPSLLTLAAIALALSGCDLQSGNGLSNAHDGPPLLPTTTWQGTGPIPVLCTTGMVADLVRNVGGNRVQVSQLMGENVDPHLYKPSPGDLRLLNTTAIIFYSGLHLEGKMAELFEQMAKRKPTFAVTAALPPDRILHTGDGAHDPHVWFDVGLWSLALDQVEAILCTFDPDHAEAYHQNAAVYREQLKDLDQYCREQLATIPSSQRVLVTAHDAFTYLGKAYDIEVRGIQGISTESEAGVHEINQLVRLLVERKIKAVFVESTVSDRNVQALVEGCRAKGHEVVIGGELYSDAMGQAGTPAGTYVGMVRHNIDTIVAALR